MALIISNHGGGDAFFMESVTGNIRLRDNVNGRSIVSYTMEQVMILDQRESSHVFKNLQIGDITGYSANSITWTITPEFESHADRFEISTQHVSDFGDYTPTNPEVATHILVRRVLTNDVNPSMILW
jgi:hypothetical protein